MPKRMLRDWTDSLRFDGISADAERLFTRLIMKADDYGRYHADPRLVKSGCFPLLDTLRPDDLGRWLSELSRRGLILLYTVKGRAFLTIFNFGQRLRESVAKFPQPDGEKPEYLATSSELPEVAASCGNCPPEVEGKGREVDADVEEETHGDLPLNAGSARVTGNLHAIIEAYVRRDAPQPSLQAIRTSIRNGATYAEILGGTQRSAAFLKGREGNKYTPNAQSFFEKEKWRSPEAYEMREDTPKGQKDALGQREGEIKTDVNHLKIRRI